MITGWFQPVFGKLRGDVFGRQVASPLPCSASFEEIVRQKTNMPANVLRIDGLKRGESRARQPDGRPLGPATGPSVGPNQ